MVVAAEHAERICLYGWALEPRDLNVSKSLLLSNFLRSLNRKELPPEVEEHRARLKRASSDPGTFERLTARWLPVMQEWAAQQQGFEQQRQVAQGAPDKENRLKELAAREADAQSKFSTAAKELLQGLEDLNQRLVAEAPSLDGYDELQHFFKERQVYQMESYPLREFQPQDERNNEDYRLLLEGAVTAAIEKARATFVPEVKRFNYALGGVAFLAANAFLASIVLFDDSPLRLSLGLLLCFDLVLGMAYIFYKMSRARETQMRAHIQAHIEHSLVKARGEITRRERERYNRWLDEETERREAFEAEQERKREAFDRMEAQRLESLQPLFSGKAAVVQAVLASLLPLRLPVPCGVSFKVHSASAVEIICQVPDDRITPPNLKGVNRNSSNTPREELELTHQCTILAAALALRHAAEIFYNIPSCQTVIVNGVRMSEGNGQLSLASQVLSAEIDRRTLGPMGRTLSPLMAIKRFKHRITGGERRERQTA